MKREKPYDMRHKPEFIGEDADRNEQIYKDRRLFNTCIEGLACAYRLSSVRIRQILDYGDRQLYALREMYGADEVIIYPFEKA